MASALDLVTAEQLPLSVQDAVEGAQLALLITAASEALAGFVGYPVHQREGVVETVASQGGAYLFLTSGAVRQVASVTVDGEEVASEEYALEVGTLGVSMGRLVRRRGRWPFTGEYSGGVSSTPLHVRDTGAVVVTFDAGWVTPGQQALTPALVVDLPAVFQLAAREVVAALVSREGKPGDLASESIGDASMSYVVSPDGGRMALPLSARQLVARYRKPARR